VQPSDLEFAEHCDPVFDGVGELQPTSPGPRFGSLLGMAIIFSAGTLFGLALRGNVAPSRVDETTPQSRSQQLTAKTSNSGVEKGQIAPPVAPVVPPLPQGRASGHQVHQVLARRGYVASDANRSSGIVVWTHRGDASRILGRFENGTGPLFDRKLLRLVMERDDRAVWIASNFAIVGSELRIETGGRWVAAQLPEPMPAEATTASEEPRPGDRQETIRGWRVTIAPLPEPTRRKIFYELAQAQDSGVDDTEAYHLMAKRFGIDVGVVYQIAGEGAVRDWPLPPLP
jgi:hypothetical protein